MWSALVFSQAFCTRSRQLRSRTCREAIHTGPHRTKRSFRHETDPCNRKKLDLHRVQPMYTLVPYSDVH